jgi:prophage maintenance system killer protein
MSRNGYEIIATQDEAETLILAVASGKIGREQIEHWLIDHVQSWP